MAWDGRVCSHLPLATGTGGEPLLSWGLLGRRAQAAVLPAQASLPGEMEQSGLLPPAYIVVTCLPSCVMGDTGQGFCVMSCRPWGIPYPQASPTWGLSLNSLEGQCGSVPHRNG